MTDRELLQQALYRIQYHYEGDPDDIEVEQAIRDRLAQPEPDPVAWQVKFCDDDGIPQIAWFPHPVHPKSNLAKRPYIEEPLYTTPPKKEWVGLTDDEIIDAANMAPFDTMVSAEDYIYIISRAIEAKLKEKNT